MKKNQNGFAHVGLVLILLAVVGVIGFAGFRLMGKQADQKSTSHGSGNEPPTSTQPGALGKIKHLGVELDYYDAATNKAGDFVFTKAKLHDGVIFMNYGHEIPATPDFPAKKNPQPSYIVPLGTKVHSLVDGKVVSVTKLYSNDYSIQVQAEGSDLVFETEHVLNPSVKQGDTVKAGDVIAEVSNHDSQHNNGMGLVEIGILKAGNPPSHVCPFDYLDESIKGETLKKITALQKSWEEYRGDTTIYDESKVVIAGCVSREPIEG